MIEEGFPTEDDVVMPPQINSEVGAKCVYAYPQYIARVVALPLSLNADVRSWGRVRRRIFVRIRRLRCTVVLF